MMSCLRIFTLLFCFFITQMSWTVPTSFLQLSQGNTPDIHWMRLKSRPFYLYFDSHQKENAFYLMKGLKNAYPYISSMFGVTVCAKNDDKNVKSQQLNSAFDNIAVVVGDRNEGPGFANPATMNIESVQNLTRYQSFYQHELTHRLMYDHFDNFLGPLGRLLTVGTLPTWFIEGFPEMITKSIGQKKTKDIVRSIALQKKWPTWDRLHSLYNLSSSEFLAGYTVSGVFLESFLSGSNVTNLYTFLKEISHNNTHFPFYNPVDQWIFSKKQTTSQKEYEKFKHREEKLWKKKVEGLPSLLEESDVEDLELETSQPVLARDSLTVISRMGDELSPFSSSLFLLKKEGNKKVKRESIPGFGSQLISLNGNKDDYFLTTQRKYFRNAAYGDDLQLVFFKGNFRNLSGKNITLTQTVPLAAEKKPYIITGIQKKSKDEFYIATSLFGVNEIFLWKKKKNTFLKIKRFPIPDVVKFVNFNSDSPCAKYILNTDNDVSSLHEICENKSERTLIPKGKWIINDAADLDHNSLLLLTYQGDLQALVKFQFSKNGQIRSKHLIAKFPERLEQLFPVGISKNKVMSWYFRDRSYQLLTLDLNKIETNFKNSQRKKGMQSLKLEETLPEEPQYQLVSKKFLDSKKTDKLREKDAQKKSVISMDNAPWSHSFFYAYPYGSFPPLGTSSVSLNAIPFQERMERDLLQVSLQYLFDYQSLNGGISYINRRILNEFSLSVFSQLRYNGEYLVLDGIVGNTTFFSKYNNFLDEKNIHLHLGYQLRPARIKLIIDDIFSYLYPSELNKNSSKNSGATKLFLNSLRPSVQLVLGDHAAFYSRHDFLQLTAQALFGAQYNRSLGDNKNSQNQKVSDLEYGNMNALLSITLRHGNELHLESLNKGFYLNAKGFVSKTLGNRTLNLREQNTVFHPDLMTRLPMNVFSNVTFVQNSPSYFIEQGDLSYYGNILASKDVLPEFESLFLIAYVSGLHFNIMGTISGVSTDDKKPTTHKAITAGFDTLLDIKGFQLVPSVNGSFLIGEKGWQVFFQLLVPGYL